VTFKEKKRNKRKRARIDLIEQPSSNIRSVVFGFLSAIYFLSLVD